VIKIDGKGGISATIVADSISEVGERITTYELEYPRFIHSEVMTHRLFSRNAASSRAIPVDKMIEHVSENTAMPIHWGMNQRGMQAQEECTDKPVGYSSREDAWDFACDRAIDVAGSFAGAGYHKQIVNRLLEPFQFIKVVLTATEFDNFFWLRKHPDAQPEIAELAKVMWEAREESEPSLLRAGEWHVPYYNGNYGYGVWKNSGYARVDTGLEPTDHKRFGYTLTEALKISASCCAQVSYRTLNNTYEKAMDIYSKLASGRKVHASPFEHVAKPMSDSPHHENGVTHKDNVGNYWSGNFKGWIQLRQTLDNHVCWKYKE